MTGMRPSRPPARTSPRFRRSATWTGSLTIFNRTPSIAGCSPSSPASQPRGFWSAMRPMRRSGRDIVLPPPERSRSRSPRVSAADDDAIDARFVDHRHDPLDCHGFANCGFARTPWPVGRFRLPQVDFCVHDHSLRRVALPFAGTPALRAPRLRQGCSLRKLRRDNMV